MASLLPLFSDTDSESEPESLTPLLEGGTSSTSSLPLGDADTSTSSDVCTPCVNRLKSGGDHQFGTFFLGRRREVCHM